MKILIIGGTRFIGPLLVKKLYERGHNLTLFNREEKKGNYEDEIRVIKGDRNNGFDIADHFDVVIDTCAYEKAHVQAVLNDLNFDFYLHIGTAASYKKTEIFPLKEADPIGEWKLWGNYNKGKVECEEVLKGCGKKFAVIRPTYILGPKNSIEREIFIYKKIKNKQPILLPGNGQALVKFVFVEDVVATILRIINEKAEGCYNCSGDDIITLKGLVEMMGEIVGIPPIIKNDPNAKGNNFNLEEFPFANENFFCDNQKIKNLGIKFTPLVEGLKKDYDEYYKNII
jgi:nucleoside-diphosphate-sugar epimerase